MKQHCLSIISIIHPPLVTHLHNELSGTKKYIDPTTYDDVSHAVEQCAVELDRIKLKLKSFLGGGEFGEVFNGTLRDDNGNVVDVAIKKLKVNICCT